MDKKFLIYGTPLSKSLQAEDDPTNEGPISLRRARAGRLQTVRDERGRQRFHGAFTGGFSAGYYNTVDSVEGFQPGNYVSSRGSSSRFSHKPEDYMDDEDLGEFGIAPKKVRVNQQFSSLEKFSRQQLESTIVPAKNDFHGLGYKPLVSHQSKTAEFSNKHEPINPLMAILSGGKRLKISGEAFGFGVLDEEEDCVETSEAYGYDDINNYEFNRSGTHSGSKSKIQKKQENSLNIRDLNDFTLASNLKAMQLCDEFKVNYPPPNIPGDWTAPHRKEPYVPPFIPPSETTKVDLNRTSGSSFHKKFTGPTDINKPSEIETRAGLLQYTDLKGVELDLRKETSSSCYDTTQASVSRQELEWRPCSLLCKHFNVPNPYPGNQYVGVKSTTKTTIAQQCVVPQQLDQQPTGVSDTANYFKPSSLELKRTIFNVIFEEPGEKGEVFYDVEEEPQVVEANDSGCSYILTRTSSFQTSVKDTSVRTDREKESSDQDEDIMIVAASKPEPEVIVLGSSSSSSSSSSSLASFPDHLAGGSGGALSAASDDDDDIETYGPPLPPTMRTLHKHSTSSRKRKERRR